MNFVSHINSGFAKKFKLKIQSNRNTRSTKNIVKKSFFDIIRFDLKESYFVECFSGSGQIGLEAISNGAKACIFFEKNIQALEILKENVRNFNFKFNSDIKVYNLDFFLSSDILSNLDNIILYFDPPFNIRDDFKYIYENIDSYMKNVKFEKKIKMIILESISNVNFQFIGNFKQYKKIKYGKTSLMFFRL